MPLGENASGGKCHWGTATGGMPLGECQWGNANGGMPMGENATGESARRDQ